MNSELNIHELDTVCGGLQDNPFKDAENQRAAASTGATGTVGGSIGGQLGFGGSAGHWGGGATGGNPI
jgi:hypothetical protein